MWVRIPPGARHLGFCRVDTAAVYSSEARARALALIENGFALRAISMSTGVSRATLRDWRDHPEKDGSPASCPRCADDPTLPEPGADYAYLLGLYLGTVAFPSPVIPPSECGSFASCAATPGPD